MIIKFQSLKRRDLNIFIAFHKLCFMYLSDSTLIIKKDSFHKYPKTKLYSTYEYHRLRL